jgi:uncharacterized protein (TIRG00374 family)
MPIPTIPQPPPGKNASSRMVVLLVGIALAAVLLYYSLRGIDWKQVGKLLSGARPGYVALMCVFASVALFLRACRWRILLSSAGPVPVGTAFWATSVGYFGNNFLPARAGELARTLMISSRCGLTNAFVLTTAMLERMVDALALVLIGALVMLTLPSPPDWLAKASRPFAIAGGCGVLLIAVLPRLERFWMAALGRIPMPPGIRIRLSSLLEHILEGFRAFHDARRAGGFLALTVVIWTMDAVGSTITARALGLELSLPLAFLLLAGLGLGSALPSTPGYVGIYQFVAIGILTPFGFSRTAAIAYILMVQAVAYALVSIWGSLGLLQYRRLPRVTLPIPALSAEPVDS